MNKAIRITQCDRLTKKIEFFCVCGYHVITKVKGAFKCPTCGNKDIINLDQKYKTKVITSEPYVIEKGLKHFHIAKDKHRITFHKDNTISVKFVGKQEFKYDLKTKERVIISGDKTYTANEIRIDNFFNRKDCTELISTPENRNLFRFAYDYLSVEKHREWNRRMGKGLVRLMDRPHLEMIYFSGFTDVKHLRDINNYIWYKYSATNPARSL